MEKVRKHQIIWILATFSITALIGWGFINPRTGLDGMALYILSAAEMFVVGYLIYDPIEKIFK